jgi:hypothetical protein
VDDITRGNKKLEKIVDKKDRSATMLRKEVKNLESTVAGLYEENE